MSFFNITYYFSVQKNYDDDVLEDMIESGNPAVFQQDVRNFKFTLSWF